MSRVFKLLFGLSRIIPGFNKFVGKIYAFDIPRKARIGKNVNFIHNALGVVIHSNAVIGDSVTILHHVTIGVNKIPDKAPVIGNNVTIQSYAMILGDVRIGDNSIIGAGSIVMHDIPENTIYFNSREEVFKPNHPA